MTTSYYTRKFFLSSFFLFQSLLVTIITSSYLYVTKWAQLHVVSSMDKKCASGYKKCLTIKWEEENVEWKQDIAPCTVTHMCVCIFNWETFFFHFFSSLMVNDEFFSVRKFQNHPMCVTTFSWRLHQPLKSKIMRTLFFHKKGNEPLASRKECVQVHHLAHNS